MDGTAGQRFACVVDPVCRHVVWDDRTGVPAMHRGRVLSYRDPRHAARMAQRLNDVAAAYGADHEACPVADLMEKPGAERVRAGLHGD